MTINIGVIGVGYLGQHHARVLSELDGVNLVAVVDPDKCRAEEIAGKHGCDAHNDYRQMLDRVDALSIVTPTTMHYEIAMDCIKAGKDVLIEKPLTATLAEADSLIKASVDAGVIIQTGHLERFNPAFSTLYPLVSAPVFIEAERLSPFLGRSLDVDITLDLMIHDIDIIMSLMKHEGVKIKDIKAAGVRMLTNTIDFAKAWIVFDNGMNAVLTASRLSTEKSRKTTVFQKDGYFLLDYQEMTVRRFSGNCGALSAESVAVERKEPLKEELKDFIKCIAERRRPHVSAVEGRNALDIALQISEQIKKKW